MRGATDGLRTTGELECFDSDYGLLCMVQELNGDGLPGQDAHLLALEFREGYWLIANVVTGVYGEGCCSGDGGGTRAKRLFFSFLLKD